MINIATHGAYPTMITPYDTDGNVDYGAVRELVRWYRDNGCAGIFAACQSSEIVYLSLADRVKLTKTVVDEAEALYRADPKGRRLMIVASGHISRDPLEQSYELNRMAETGADAIILITNRMDVPNTSNENWIRDTERLVSSLPNDIALGAYECPFPYKRLMTSEMLKWCADSGRFFFMKDTCCDADLIDERVKLLSGSKMSLFNANAQTLLDTLKSGGAGYCGVMCNFHPKLYSWLCEHWRTSPETAERVQSFLCLAAFTESLCYPVTAKYYLKSREGICKTLFSRSADERRLTAYHCSCIDQMTRAADTLISELGL